MLGTGKILEDNLIGHVKKKTIIQDPKNRELSPVDYDSIENEQDEARKLSLEKLKKEDIKWKFNAIKNLGLPYFFETIEKHQPLNETPYKKILEYNLNSILKDDPALNDLGGKVKVNTCVGTSIDQLFGIDGFITFEDKYHSYDKSAAFPPMYINFDLTMNPNKTEARNRNSEYEIVILGTNGREIGYSQNDDKKEFMEVMAEHVNILAQEIYNRAQREYAKYQN